MPVLSRSNTKKISAPVLIENIVVDNKVSDIELEFLSNIHILNKNLEKFNLIIKSTFLFGSPLINIVNHYKREVYQQLRWYIEYKRNNKFSNIMIVNTMETEKYIQNCLSQIYNGSKEVYNAIRCDFK